MYDKNCGEDIVYVLYYIQINNNLPNKDDIKPYVECVIRDYYLAQKELTNFKNNTESLEGINFVEDKSRDTYVCEKDGVITRIGLLREIII